MSTTGVIFAAIAVAWLAYLVPHFVRRRDDDPVEEVDPADRFSESVRVVEHGTAPLLDQDLSEIDAYEVSTPLTRRAAVNDLRRLERIAATRRRRVLLILMALLSAVIGVVAVELLPWWSAAVAGGLVVVFFVVSRVSVAIMRRSLDRRYAEIRSGGEEVTIFLGRRTTKKKVASPATDESGKPASSSSGLWDPIPITTPTYVSKPLAPRTVRTIDLSGPPLTSNAAQPPITADAPESVAGTEDGTIENLDSNGLRKGASA